MISITYAGAVATNVNAFYKNQNSNLLGLTGHEPNMKP